MKPSPVELLGAIELALKTQSPLPFWQIAKACNLTEDEVVSLLILSLDQGAVVAFKYPPIPCGAVVSVTRRITP